jgi:hypothetical protein
VGLINKALELPFPEPVETYSSSQHLYTDLSIPEGTKGTLPRSARVRAGLGAEQVEDLGRRAAASRQPVATGRDAGRDGGRSGGRDGGRDGGRSAGRDGGRPAAGTRPSPPTTPRSSPSAPAPPVAGPAAAARLSKRSPATGEATSNGSTAPDDAGPAAAAGGEDGGAPRRRRRGGRGRGKGAGEAGGDGGAPRRRATRRRSPAVAAAAEFVESRLLAAGDLGRSSADGLVRQTDRRVRCTGRTASRPASTLYRPALIAASSELTRGCVVGGAHVRRADGPAHAAAAT